MSKHARKFITAYTDTGKEDEARRNRIENKLTTEKESKGNITRRTREKSLM
jgi:hypothetical protein